MSIFKSLGDAANVPKVVNEAASSITSFVETNFNLPSISQKAAELGSKLGITGQLALFSKAVVDKNPIDPVTLAAHDEQFRQEMIRQLGDTGVPSNLIAGSADGPSTNELKVKITQTPHVPGGPNEVTFTVMPKIDETNSAEYEAVNPIHHPGGIQKYKNTSARTWNVSARLMSRTVAEATQNLAIVNMIRSWTKPFHGEGTSVWAADKLGAPPPILTLSAYGPNMIGPVKCVLKSYNWSFDNGLDYITTMQGNPFPVLLDVSLQLEEAWSPSEYSGFDLAKYKQGDLREGAGAFTRVVAGEPVRPTVQTTSSGPAAQTNEPQQLGGAGRGLVNPLTVGQLNEINRQVTVDNAIIDYGSVASQ